jgi:hypothetical protein
LLFGALHHGETHRRTDQRFTDRFGISRIILVRLDVRLDVLRRDQPDLVPERLQLARPIALSRTGLQPDQTRWQFGEETQHLASPQPFAQHRSPLPISRVNLKDPLC